jgi:hypothetical protein
MPPRPVSYGKQYFDSDQVMAKVLIETVVKLVESQRDTCIYRSRVIFDVLTYFFQKCFNNPVAFTINILVLDLKILSLTFSLFNCSHPHLFYIKVFPN